MPFDAGSIIARMRMDAAGFRSEISGVKKELGGLTEWVNKNKEALKGLAYSAGAAFAAMTLELKKAAGASVELKNSMMGLESVARGVGEDVDRAKRAAQELAADGLMSVADAATGLKNLLAAGFSLDQAITLMERFKDSAAFGRQASLSFGDAVRSATEGIKNGNSILVDNAGVTKNLSIMLEEAGYSAQDLSRASQDAGVRAAIFNGILRETQNQVGDAARLAESFGGSLARTSETVDKLHRALGNALAGPLGRLLGVVEPLIGRLADWIENNKALAGGLALVGTGLTGAVASISAWLLAAPTLKKSITLLAESLVSLVTSPITWVIVGLTAMAGIAYLVVKNWDLIKKAAQDLGKAIAEYFGAIWDNIKTTLRAIGQSAAAFWQFIKDIFTMGPAAAWDKFVQSLADVRTATAKEYKAMVFDASAFGEDISNLWADVKKQVGGLWAGFKGFFAPGEEPAVPASTGGKGAETGAEGTGKASARNEALEKALAEFEVYKARLAAEMQGLTGEALTNAIVASHQKQVEWLQKNILGVQGLIKTQEERGKIESIIFDEMLARYEQIAERDNWTTEQRLANLDTYVTRYATSLEALSRVDNMRQELLRQQADEDARAKDQAYAHAMELYRKETEGLQLSAEQRKKIFEDIIAANLPAAMRSAEAQKAIDMQLLVFDREIAAERASVAGEQSALSFQLYVESLERQGRAKDAAIARENARYAEELAKAGNNLELRDQVVKAHLERLQAIEDEDRQKREEAERKAADALALVQKQGLDAELEALRQKEEEELATVEAGSQAEKDIRARYELERQRTIKEWNQRAEVQQLELHARLLEAQGDYKAAALAREEARWKTERAQAEEAGGDLETIDRIHEQNVLNIKQEYADKRLAIEEKYRQAVEALGKTARQKELADIDAAEQAALEEARKAGADTTNIVAYYNSLRAQVNQKYDEQEKLSLAEMQAELLDIQGRSYEARIAREDASWERIKADTSLSQAELELAEKLHKERLAQIDKEAADERIAIERKYHDLLADLSLTEEEQEIAALRRQRQTAIEEARQKGAATADIEAYFDRLETQTRKRYADERAEFAQQYHDKVASLSQSSLERELFNLDREREAALKEAREKITDAQELGKVEADINAFYNSEKTRVTEEYNQRIADASRQLQIDLLRANGEARKADIEAENLAYEQKLRNQELTDKDREALAELHRRAIDEINSRYDEEERQAQAELNIDYLRMKGDLLGAELAEEDERHRKLIANRKWTQAELEKLEEIHQAKITEIRKKYEYKPGFLGRVLGGGFATPEERQRYEAGVDTKTGANLGWMDQLKRAGELLVAGVLDSIKVLKDVVEAVITGNWVQVIVDLVQQTESFQRIVEILNQALSAVVEIVDALLEPLVPIIQGIVDALRPWWEAMARLASVLGKLIGAVLEPIVRFMTPIIELMANVLMPIIKVIANLWNAIIKALAGINIFGWQPFAGLTKYLIDTSAWDQEDQGEAGAAPGKQGTQISEITGPTRDLLVSLLSPLKSLDMLPGLFASMETAIYEMRDAFLSGAPAPALAGASAAGGAFHIDMLVVEANVEQLSDLDKFMRLMGDKARLVAKGRGD